MSSRARRMGDSGMIEILAKPILVIMVFLAVFSLMISFCNPVLTSGYTQKNEISAGVRANIGRTYGATAIANNEHYFQPVYTNSSTIHWGTSYYTLFGNSVSDATPITYTGTSPNDVLVFFTTEWPGQPHDPYTRWTNIYVHQVSGFFGSYEYHITPEMIIAGETNASVTNIPVILGTGYTLHISANWTTLDNVVYNTTGNFCVSFSQSIYNLSAAQASGNILSTLGNVLTFTVPNVPMYVNLILACVLIPTYIMLIFFIVRSLIPTLGG